MLPNWQILDLPFNKSYSCSMSTDAAIKLMTIFIHPLKSAAGLVVDQALVAMEGLVGDRRYLVSTLDGTFISARSHPRLVLVKAEIHNDGLLLTAPGMTPLNYQRDNHKLAVWPVAVWKDQFDAFDCGPRVAAWISDFLGEELRFSWLGESCRPLRWDRGRRTTFADAAPLLAVSQASVDAVSAEAGMVVSARRFRPNLVLEGVEAFAEDHWRRIRIGEVEFQMLDGCARCELTTVDPDTGIKHPANEPLASLKQFRETDTGVYFGMNLMPQNTGTIRTGDQVHILERRQPLVFSRKNPLGHRQENAIVSSITAAATMVAPWDSESATLICTAVENANHDCKTFSFRRQDGTVFDWDAGQYLRLVITVNGQELRRCYSLSSAPDGGGTCQITVKRLAGGLVSVWMHQNLTPGVVIAAEGIGGHFAIAQNPWESLLFLGAGSGITPLMAMLRWLDHKRILVDLVLHHSARSAADFLFRDELESMQKRWNGRLRVFFSITGPEGNGRLNHTTLLEHCVDLRDRRIFACGPTGYRQTVRALLLQTGVKLDLRYHEEIYGDAGLEAPDADHAVSGVVTFTKSGKSVVSDGRLSLLHLAERAGIAISSSCRVGDCGTCRVKRLSGRTFPEGSDTVLACETFPLGDVSVDL